MGRVSTVDQVGVEQRVDSLKRRSIKKDSKLWALDLAIRMMDLTTLEGKDTPGKVRALCVKAMRPKPGDPTIPHVAAVCVYPALVADAKDALRGSGVKVASVATGFPSGQTFRDIKIAETRAAVEAGADEVDMVIDRGAFLSGDYQTVFEDRVQTCYRPVQRTTMKECRTTVMRPVYEQHCREYTYPVSRPIYEEREEVCRYTQMRPVYEQHVRQHCYTVQKPVTQEYKVCIPYCTYHPVYQQHYRTECYTVMRPVYQTYQVPQHYCTYHPVYQQHYRTREEARLAIFECIECFYNRTRMHSTLDYRSPEEYERSVA